MPNLDSDFADFDYASVAPEERGFSFHLLPEPYRRLASAALAIPGRPPMFLRRLKYKGCALDVYGSEHLLTITVLPGETIASISLFTCPLDSANEPAILFTGDDTPDNWRCLTSVSREKCV